MDTLDEIFAALDATQDEPVLIEADRDRRPPQDRPALDALCNDETASQEHENPDAGKMLAPNSNLQRE